MLTTDYQVNNRRSLPTIRYPLRHVLDYFSPATRATTITTDRLTQYVAARQHQGAATASIQTEFALLGRAFTLAVRAKRLRRRPHIPMPQADESAVRQGFVSRETMDAICAALDPDLADFVRFLFFSAWRPIEVRTLPWRDYDRTEAAEHRTNSMLKRYHIINLDDLRRAASRASDYQGESATITPLPERTRREPAE